MPDSLPVLKKKLLSHPYVQKSKKIIEDNVCHPNESLYHHLTTTSQRAENATKGEFITDSGAKKQFEMSMNNEVHGMKYREIAIVVALLHDIGKILVYNENGKQFPLNESQKDGTTHAPGHEYWGSTIAPTILSDVGVEEELALFIAKLIGLHGLLLFPNFDRSKTVQENISLVKTLGQEYEKEILFNTYADVALCPIFKDWLAMIEHMFNTREFYVKREYVVI
ncbi:MAG TPA: hypothetical protein VLF93_05535 [Candidatus Saccharimonadales bacterium]|nr:hypothetical protein [Candidatus Saccharimonadales bacterium]